MADDQAPLGDALVVEDKNGLLKSHFFDRFTGLVEIVRRTRESQGEPGGKVFKVGQVYIDDPLEMGQDRGLFVAVGVRDDRDFQTPRVSEPQGPEDGQDEVRRRDQVDVERPFVLEAKHQPGQLLVSDRPALPEPAQLIVLTESALEVAARKEDRPRPRAHLSRLTSAAGAIPCAAQDRLFAEMEQGVGYDGHGAALAKPLFSSGSIDSAIAGAKAAIRLVRPEPGQGGVNPVYFSPGDHVGLGIFIHSIRILLLLTPQGMCIN